MTIARYPTRDFSIYRVQLQSPDTCKSILGDEALDAFRRMLRYDDSRMEAVYGSQGAALIRQRDYEARSRLAATARSMDDGGESFLSSIANLQRNVQNFMQTDEWRRMQEEFGDGCGGDSEDEDEDDGFPNIRDLN